MAHIIKTQAHKYLSKLKSFDKIALIFIRTYRYFYWYVPAHDIHDRRQ